MNGLLQNSYYSAREYIFMPLGSSGLRDDNGGSMKLVVIAVSRDAQENFSFGVENSIWGFPKLWPDSDQITAGTAVLLDTKYVNRNGRGNPRVDFNQYRDGKVVSAVIARATGSTMEVLDVPLWPDETETGEVRYPVRFPLSPIAAVRDLEFLKFPLELAKAFHLSINGQGKPVAIDVNQETLDRIAWLGQLPSWPLRENGNSDSGVVDADELVEKKGRTRGAGRSQDAALNKAIENRAVELAKLHYENDGWRVLEKGKPYDLLCTRDGLSLRVEVKGTQSLGATVELTINEVNSARQNPSELFVVRNIRVHRRDGVPIASGGDARVFTNWQPINIKPTKFIYEVPWEVHEGMDLEVMELVF